MEGNFIKVMKLLQYIPEFSGKRIKNIIEEMKQFINSTEQINNVLNDEQKTILVKLIFHRLRGDAFSVASRFKYESLTELFNELKRHFIPIKSPTDVISEINLLKQLPSEKIIEFGARLQDLVTTAKELYQTKYPTKDTTLLEEEVDSQAIKTFKKGIFNVQLKTSLMTYNEKSLTNLVDIAISLEDSYFCNQLTYQNVNTISSNKYDEISTEIKQLKEELAIIKDRDTQNTFCSNCNNYGHSEFQCQNFTNNNEPL